MHLSGSRPSDWHPAFMRDCQILAHHALNDAPKDMIVGARALLSRLPPTLTGREQMMTAAVLVKVAAAIVQCSHLETHPAVAKAMMFLAAASLSPHWLDAFRALSEACEATLCDQSNVVQMRVSDVQRCLMAIERGYKDPAFSLDHAAREAHVSPRQLSRVLRERTGMTFTTHLRQRRINAARTLMSDPALSLKEIIADVGYQTRRAFERDFRRLCGRSASELRLSRTA